MLADAGRPVNLAILRCSGVCVWRQGRICPNLNATTRVRTAKVVHSGSMATVNPRVQVTIDPELGEALAAVEAHPRSKSRLIRDLALRGAEVAAEEGRKEDAAIEVLCKIADGEISYDFETSREIHAERERSVPERSK